MSQWFRFYTEALDDPKVQRLDGETFKAWVNLLCLTCRNDGKLPPLMDIAFALRIDEHGARTVVERLLNAGLIDKTSGGAHGFTYAPHGWNQRQYKSDTSTDRVKRFRQRSKPVTETPPETEAETEVSVAKATAPTASADKDFWANAKAYLGGDSKGALIGRWRRDFGQEATANAITAAQLERAVDPVSYITATLKARAGPRAAVGI